MTILYLPIFNKPSYTVYNGIITDYSLTSSYIIYLSNFTYLTLLKPVCHSYKSSPAGYSYLYSLKVNCLHTGEYLKTGKKSRHVKCFDNLL